MIARYDRFCQCNSCNWRCFGENVSKVEAQACSLRGNNFSVKYWMPKHYKGVHVMVILSVNCVAAHWGAAAQHANILLYTTKLGDTRARHEEKQCVPHITHHSWLKIFFGTDCINCSFSLGRFFCPEMWGKFSIVWFCVQLLPLSRITVLIRASLTKFCLFVIHS
jgi:hypothetical protein